MEVKGNTFTSNKAMYVSTAKLEGKTTQISGNILSGNKGSMLGDDEII